MLVLFLEGESHTEEQRQECDNAKDTHLGNSPPCQGEREVWNLEDVEVQLVEEKEVQEPQAELAASSCQCPELSFSVIDPEERALLNLLSFEKRGPRGLRWSGSNSPRKVTSNSSRVTERDRAKRRARLECRNIGMLERLQHCLTRAETRSSSSTLENLKALEGECSLSLLPSLFTL